MEEFKKLEEVNLPDRRNTHYILIDRQTGHEKDLAFKDWYQSVASIELNIEIPETIKSQFNIARNLAIYTWFCYQFHQICEMKVFSTVEYALREKYNCHVKYGEKSRMSFRGLLEKSVADGFLKDSGFSHLKNDSKQASNDWVKELPSLMCKFRNDLAHGSQTLHNGSWLNLRICAELINQLFDKPK